MGFSLTLPLIGCELGQIHFPVSSFSSSEGKEAVIYMILTSCHDSDVSLPHLQIIQSIARPTIPYLPMRNPQSFETQKLFITCLEEYVRWTHLAIKLDLNRCESIYSLYFSHLMWLFIYFIAEMCLVVGYSSDSVRISYKRWCEPPTTFVNCRNFKILQIHLTPRVWLEDCGNIINIYPANVYLVSIIC